MSEGPLEVEGGVELAVVEGDGRVGGQHLAQVAPLGGGGRGVALDDAVGVVARDSRGHQGQQDRLAEDEAPGPLGQVGQGAPGVDHQARGQARRLALHVEGEQRGVGQDHPLDRAVRDVPLVPEGDVLEAGPGVAAQHPGQPAEPLGEDRVALVGHGRAALLAGGEGLGRLAHLGAGQVADLGGDQLDRRPDRGAGVEVLGVAVPGDDLGGRHRPEAERPADVGLHHRVDVGVGPDRPRQLADGHACAGRAQPLAVAVGLEGPEGELGPEGRGLGRHPVGAAGDRDVDQLGAPGPPGRPPGRRPPRGGGRRPRPGWRTGRCRPRPRR